MNQVFDMAYSKWKAAFQDWQDEIAESRQSASATEIHEITHDRFAKQGRAATLLHFERRQREAEMERV